MHLAALFAQVHWTILDVYADRDCICEGTKKNRAVNCGTSDNDEQVDYHDLPQRFSRNQHFGPLQSDCKSLRNCFAVRKRLSTSRRFRRRRAAPVFLPARPTQSHPDDGGQSIQIWMDENFLVRETDQRSVSGAV
jgi:hypothetical protein